MFQNRSAFVSSSTEPFFYIDDPLADHLMQTIGRLDRQANRSSTFREFYGHGPEPVEA